MKPVHFVVLCIGALFSAHAGSASATTCSGAGGCSTSVGSDYSEVVAGLLNSISTNSNYSLVAGGKNNTISVYDASCAIVGGESNAIASYGWYNFIGGGFGNYIYGGSSSTYGNANTIGGGYLNKMLATESYSFIGGGYSNNIYTSYATIAGGASNVIRVGDYATICGGQSNTIDTNGLYATIAGGYSNLASGWGASVLGGSGNIASGSGAVTVGGAQNTASGIHSFAAGNHANADQHGCFVWADRSGYTQDCKIYPQGQASYSSANSFVVRALGGVEFITNVNGSGTPIAGVYLGMGASAWSQVSDRNKKHDFHPIDPQEVLRRVVAMPVTTWKYNSEASGARHMGPMAQDFYAAFGLGDDDRHVTSIDEAGAALAAIQGLHAEVIERGHTIKALTDRATALTNLNASLEKANAEANRRVAALERRLEQIEAQLGLTK